MLPRQLRVSLLIGGRLLGLGRLGLVALSRGPVHGLDPQGPLGIVVCCEQYVVTFPDCVEEALATLQIYWKIENKRMLIHLIEKKQWKA